MNEIEIKIDFTKGTLATKGIALITGDYASTMLKFTFDREDGTKVFEMKNPSDEVVYVGEIINGEILLTSKVDVTTIHNNKTYTKYTKNDAIYWYQPTDNKLFTDEWVEVSTFNLEEYTKVQVNASLFNESGKYIFEVSLYKDDTKLTSTKGILPVKQEQVIVGDEIVEAYIPIFDQLIQEINEKITEANNLDLDVTDTSGVVEATLTKKDGTTKTVEIIDRNDYYDKDEVDAIQTTIEAEIPTKVSELDNDLNFIDNTVDDLTNYTKTSDLGAVALSNDYDDLTDKPNLSIYSLITETGNKIDLEINSSTYVLTAKMYDKNNNLLSTSTGIDLPLETMVVGARYDDTTKSIILTLKNGQEVSFSVADLVSGLQTEITSDNKLSSDLVDDTNSTNKFVTTSEKTTWNNKSDFSGSYNDLTNKPDLTLKEDKSNKVTSLSNTSTDIQYPSAKCMYDSQEAQDELITELEQENELLLDQIPKGTATGQDITLNDSSNLPIKSIEISGNTSQDTTTGKNKLPYTNDINETINSTKITGVKGTYTIQTTPTATVYQTYVNLVKNYTIQSGDYLHIMNDVANANITFNLKCTDDTILSPTLNSVNRIFDLSSYVGKTISSIRFYVSTSYDGAKITLTPMIVNSETATEWEQFTFGASPNPDYPQEVKVVKGDNKIKVEGKNLNDGINDYFYITSTGTSYKYSSSDNGICIKVNGGNYTISTTATQTRYRVACSNELPSNESKECYNGVSKDETSNTITIDTTGYKYLLVNATNINIIQIEKGSSATTYAPYKETDYSLNLGVENLFDKNAITDNKWLTISGGEETSNNYCISDYIEIQQGQSYYLPKLGTKRLKYFNSSKQALTNDWDITNGDYSQILTIPTNAKYVRFSILKTSVDINTFQFEEGSIAHSYSEYGVEPLELCKIGNYKDVFVKPSGNNLFDESQLLEATGWTYSNGYYNGTFTNFNTKWETNGFSINIDGPKQHTLSLNYYVSGGSAILRFVYSDDTYTGITLNSTTPTSVTLTSTSGKTISKIIGTYASGGSNTLYIKNMMLNEGTTALPYEPYNNNKWYKKAYIGKVVLDGSETWNGYTTLDAETTTWFQMTALDNALPVLSITNSYLYSDNFTIFNCYNPSPNQGLCYHSDRKIQIRILTSLLSDASSLTKRIESFKNWLSTHNTAVYYILSTPQYTLCTDTLQTQLDNIWNMKTNKNVTNISITSDDLKPYLDIVYRKDLETLLGG